MKITILGSGTSQGVPVIGCDCKVCKSIDYRDKRLRSSILIEKNNTTVVIDCGPDFRQQMLREQVQNIDAIVFTHQHKDHTAGLDDIRAFNFKHNKDIPLYGQLDVLEQLKQEFAYIFAEHHYAGLPQVELKTINKNPFNIHDINFVPIEVLHHKLTVFGYRIENFAYITDANFISIEEKEKLKNLEVLVLNALRKSKHVSHFNLDEALEVIAEIKPKKAYLTHISHYMGLHKQVEQELPENVFLAYDGQKIEI